MKLIIGLGNPGKQYEKTRHNIGWMILDEFYLAHQEDFDNFSENKKFQAEVATGNLNGEKIILAKPLTFMNNSGRAVQALLNFYKLTATDLIVIHDDLDLEMGKVKMDQDRSSAGHNGIKSIIEMLGTKAFARLRVGVGKERRGDAAKFVLNKFGFFEKGKLKRLIAEATEILKKSL